MSLPEPFPSQAAPRFESLWTVRQVAEYLHASTDFVYENSAKGAIPCLRLGGLLRFEPETIRRWARGELAGRVALRTRQKP